MRVLASSALCLAAGGFAMAGESATVTNEFRPSAAFRMEVNGFTVVEDGAGTTGRRSSYHGKTMDDDALYALPVFEEKRLKYGGRLVPAAGSGYDQGVIGYRVDGDDLVIAVASMLDPNEWTRGDGGNLIGQGDLFVTVQQNEDVYQYALLNELNQCRSLGNGGRWNEARNFRYVDQDAVGHAVMLDSEDQVLISGGQDGHARGDNSPLGLDERILACGGEDTGVGEVEHYFFEATQPLMANKIVTWHVTEWTVPLAILGDEEEAMELALHIAPTCGNDQIGGRVKVPSKEERDAAEQKKKSKKRKKEIA